MREGSGHRDCTAVDGWLAPVGDEAMLVNLPSMDC